MSFTIFTQSYLPRYLRGIFLPVPLANFLSKPTNHGAPNTKFNSSIKDLAENNSYGKSTVEELLYLIDGCLLNEA